MPLSSILWQPVVLVVELGNKEHHEKTIELPQKVTKIFYHETGIKYSLPWAEIKLRTLNLVLVFNTTINNISGRVKPV